jgi:hypothetical protein
LTRIPADQSRMKVKMVVERIGVSVDRAP